MSTALLFGVAHAGPLFEKYNAVLRGVNSEVAFLRDKFETLCKGNCYTTTLHVINSAIIKSSKLTKVTKARLGYPTCGA